MNPEWNISCTISTSEEDMPLTALWVKRREASVGISFALAVWIWKEVPTSLRLKSEKRKERSARSAIERPNLKEQPLKLQLCFPLYLLENSSRNPTCQDQLGRMILAKELFGLPRQCINTQLRKRWFDKDTFDSIKTALVARMISEAYKSYDAQAEEVLRGSVMQSEV